MVPQSARAFQDLVLEAIASGSYSENIAVKGGVLMRELSHSARRATMDIDMDFMHFPLTNEGISRFVDSLNVKASVDLVVKLSRVFNVRVETISELSV